MSMNQSLIFGVHVYNQFEFYTVTEKKKEKN
jgi:hypothetical protein